MTLLAFGINHRTAALELRERLAFAPDALLSALREALRSAQLNEVAILSTCNRTEVYAELAQSDTQAVLQWLADYHHLDIDRIRQSAYQFWDLDAVRHVMRVASGLDSMVLGEPQILGQLKTAYAQAREGQCVGPMLGRLFQQVFAAAKQVRTETGIGMNPVSVAYAAVTLARHIFSDLARTTALLIGAGETVELVARHLKEQGVRHIIVANRTLARAQALTEAFAGEAIVLSDIPHHLARADIVISSTASPLPILGKGAVEQALRQRKHQPMFMMDIAVPRDIEPEVGELADVYLYTVDDLQQVVAENRKQREQAAQQAETIIQQRAQQFMDSLRTLEAGDTIARYRQQVESLRQQELQKALRQLEAGEAPAEVLQRMSRSLSNKIMHQPTTQLRKAAETGCVDRLAWAQELLGLSQSSTTTDATELPLGNEDT